MNTKTELCTEKKNITKLWNKDFFLLWQGQLVSALGDSVYEIALGFWVLAKTGSTALMGMLMAASVIPRVFISPFAGTFIDRHNRKTILVFADLIRGIAITFIGIAALQSFIEIWMVLIGGIILGICGSFFNPAVQSAIPDIVPNDKLVKANSAFSIVGTGTNIIGKTSGGFLLQLLGAPIMFLFNGISYILSACTECFIKVPNINKDIKALNFMDDLKAGLKYVKNFTGLRYLYITISVLNFFAVMGITLLLPFFNNMVYLGPEKYGIAMAFSTGGMFIGLLILSSINLKRVKRTLLFYGGGILSAISMGILPFIPNYFIIIILLFINGVCVAVINTMIQSSMQSAVPKEMRGKVFGFRSTLSSFLMPMGMAIGGILAEFIPISLIIAVGFGIILILFSILSFIKPVRELINYKN